MHSWFYNWVNDYNNKKSFVKNGDEYDNSVG